MTGLNPLDWFGTAFLVLYGGLFLSACILSSIIADWLRPAGRPGTVGDADEIAVLFGKKDRFPEMVGARLLARDAIVVEKNELHVMPGASAQNPAESAVLALPSPFKWPEMQRVTRPMADRTEAGLVERGLLMQRAEARILGIWSAIPLALLIGFGALKHDVGVARDRPVGFLTVFMIITAVVALLRVFGIDRRTKAGIAAWQDARFASSRLRAAPTRDEAAMAVALFGTGVLATSALGDFHRMRQAGSSGDGGGGDSGDGGGCGGGCGGCG